MVVGVGIKEPYVLVVKFSALARAQELAQSSLTARALHVGVCLCAEWSYWRTFTVSPTCQVDRRFQKEMTTVYYMKGPSSEETTKSDNCVHNSGK